MSHAGPLAHGLKGIAGKSHPRLTDAAVETVQSSELRSHSAGCHEPLFAAVCFPTRTILGISCHPPRLTFCYQFDRRAYATESNVHRGRPY